MGSIEEFRVLIVGAGTCGLAIAQGLQKVWARRKRDSIPHPIATAA